MKPLTSSSTPEDLDPYALELDLDIGTARSRKVSRARHFNTVKLPSFRILGLVSLCLLVYLHNHYVLETMTRNQFGALCGFLLSYGVLSWILLQTVYDAWPESGIWFLFLDLPVWSVVIYNTGADQSWLFPVLLNRVADQTNTNFRRVVGLLHVAAVCYLVTIGLSHLFQSPVDWSQAGTKFMILYICGAYVSFTARTSEALRRRTTTAIEVARGLIFELDREKATTHQAVEAKNRFMMLISHELRTPLNSILGFSELLEDEVFGPINTKQKRYVKSIHQGGKRLLSLVEEVLSYADADAADSRLNIERIDCECLFLQVVQKHEVSLSEKNLELQTQVTGSGQLKADPEKIAALLSTLLDLAVTLSPPGGRVDLLYSEASASAKLSLVICSVEIKAEELLAFQNPFERSSRREGLGLELPLVRHILRAHGGFLKVNSLDDGGIGFDAHLPG